MFRPLQDLLKEVMPKGIMGKTISASFVCSGARAFLKEYYPDLEPLLKVTRYKDKILTIEPENHSVATAFQMRKSMILEKMAQDERTRMIKGIEVQVLKG